MITYSSATAECLVGLPAALAHGQEFSALAQRLDAPASMYWEAVSAWLGPRPEQEFLAILIRDASELVGAAFLTRRLRHGVWRFAKAGTPGEPFVLLASSEEAARLLAAAVHRQLIAVDGPWELRLTDLAAEDTVKNELVHLLDQVEVQDQLETPLMRFDRGAGINTYLTRNVRSAVAKARNRIAREDHVLTINWHSAPGVVERSLDEIVQVRRERDRQLQRAPTDDKQELQTFVDTIAQLSEAGCVRLLEVRIDSKLAAFAVCFLTAGTLWVYSNAVSPDHLHFSAGTIANAEVVRVAHADPEIRVLSWGAGIQRYKLSGRIEVVTSEVLTGWSSRGMRSWLQARRWLGSRVKVRG